MASVPLNQPPQCGSSIAVPAHGHGNFTVSCSTTITAPPLICLETVLNAAQYPRWNTFCPRVVIEDSPPLSGTAFETAPELRQMAERANFLYSGVKFQFEAVMKLGQAPHTTSLEVSILENLEKDGRVGYRVAWKMRGMPHFLLHAERVQEFVEGKDGSGTEYYCWETFGGILSYFLRYSLGSQLEDGFQRWMCGMKKDAEKAEVAQ